MKIILIVSLLFITVIINDVFSYDAVIKDNQGRVTGYMDTDGDKTYILDKLGRLDGYTELKGTIKDKYGLRKSNIEKDD